MAGYAAMSRVQGAQVRAMAWPDGRANVDAAPAARARSAELTGSIVDDGPEPTILERLGWLREELGMMTFFLLDPESWR
jgi:hypothetical protein